MSNVGEKWYKLVRNIVISVAVFYGLIFFFFFIAYLFLILF